MKRSSARTHSYAEPDRRYWRRRNRSLHRARRTRKTLRWSALVGANLVLLAALVYTAGKVVRHLTSSREFSLAEIRVEGTRMASRAEILADLQPFLGRNVIELDLEAVASRAAARPWVSRAAVKRVLPAAIRVTVFERNPAALAILGGIAHVIDDTGFPIGPAGPEGSCDLPVLTGIRNPEGAHPHRTLARGVLALRRLREHHPEWAEEISEIDLSRADRVTVTTVAPGPRLVLDPARVERNLDHFLALSEEIEKRVSGAEYVDLRWRDRISLGPGTKS